ncbi:hypothetical protein [Sorangium cellulosum]|uniref:Uncharacterized protein n=1 Tax=Sorangium cellulosum So0157-2 TaxID=1254432 RepID=S4Y7Y4_SORCE|nr:hypothetical protein [Sorangium cellulosum]AGP41562.1 hypothetical protein SCE1572_47975 [Sorangium cellulosum So0157-2]
MSQGAKDIGLSAEERRALYALIKKLGERALLVELNVSRQALGRALAGLGVRRGTIALVRGGLASPKLRAVLEEHDNQDENATCNVGEAMSVGASVAGEAERSMASRRAP